MLSGMFRAMKAKQTSLAHAATSWHINILILHMQHPHGITIANLGENKCPLHSNSSTSYA